MDRSGYLRRRAMQAWMGLWLLLVGCFLVALPGPHAAGRFTTTLLSPQPNRSGTGGLVATYEAGVDRGAVRVRGRVTTQGSELAKVAIYVDGARAPYEVLSVPAAGGPFQATLRDLAPGSHTVVARALSSEGTLEPMGASTEFHILGVPDEAASRSAAAFELGRTSRESGSTPFTDPAAHPAHFAFTNSPAIRLQGIAKPSFGRVLTSYRVVNLRPENDTPLAPPVVGTLQAVPGETIVYDIPWDLAEGTDGVRVVGIQFTDDLGHDSPVYKRALVLDTTPPVLQIRTPEADSDIRQPVVQFAGDLKDDTAGIALASGTVWRLRSRGGEPLARVSDGGLRVSPTGTFREETRVTRNGFYRIRVTVVDFAGNTTEVVREWTQSARPSASSLAPSTLGTPLEITTTSLPDAEAGSPYAFTLSAAGGTSPYSWSGTGPGGLAVASNGTLSGLAPAPGLYFVTVIATDAEGQFVEKTLPLNVNGESQVGPLTILTSSLPEGATGQWYDCFLLAAGGHEPYFWSVPVGTLPPGMGVDGGGFLRGVPMAGGLYNFTLRVTDAVGQTAEVALTLSISSIPLSIVTDALPEATVGSAYSVTLFADGGMPPYTWMHTGGNLPPGLMLGEDGTLSGYPNQSGEYCFTVVVADGFGNSAEGTFNLTVTGDPPVFLDGTLPTGWVGVTYEAAPRVQGGSWSLSWSVVGGSLPPGLELSSYEGIIRGTPYSAGSYSFRLRVDDAYGQWAEQDFTIVVDGNPPVILTADLPDGVVGEAYSAQLQVNGTAGWVYWSITGGQLPPGLMLEDYSGTISGIPMAPGTFTFTASAMDYFGQSAQAEFSITIEANNPVIITETLPDGRVGEAYAAALEVLGGMQGYYYWMISAGSLPPGLELGYDGTIYGMPSAPGVFAFTVRVFDYFGQSAERELTIEIEATPPVILTDALPDGRVGEAYSSTLSALGSSWYFWWSVTDGALPPGLSLEFSGEIRGTPSAAGVYTFTVGVYDMFGQSASRTLSITVTPNPPVITTTALPDGQVGESYSALLEAMGGVPYYYWQVSAGSLPPGLSIDEWGQGVSGTPSAAGEFAFTVRVYDSFGQSDEKQLTITITADPPLILTEALPNGTVGASYFAQLEAGGGSAPYSWSVQAGALPVGLFLDDYAGTIGGTPIRKGTYIFTIAVYDAYGQTDQRQFTIVIEGDAPVITTETLPDGAVGQAYAAQLAATGGSEPYFWSIADGSLPPGISLNESTGSLEGAPGVAGAYPVTFQVTDAYGQSDDQALSVSVIADLPVIVTTHLPLGYLEQPYIGMLEATGGVAPYLWGVLEGHLPPGLYLDHESGYVLGAPQQTGTFPFLAAVFDNFGQLATRTLSITVRVSGNMEEEEGDPVTIVTPSVPDGGVGDPYYTDLDAVGGAPSGGGTEPNSPLGVRAALSAEGGAGDGYTWSIVEGSLPTGLSLSGDTITGTPTMPATATFTVQATDSLGVSDTQQYSMYVYPPLQITTLSPLPKATLNYPYHLQFAATGGNYYAYTWDITGGALPPGMQLNTQTGVLSGSPQLTGPYDFTVRVRDQNYEHSDTENFHLDVIAYRPLNITSTSPLPKGKTGQNYQVDLQAEGGTQPYTWTYTGTLPPGLSLSSGGSITGKPTSAGPFDFTAKVTDSQGAYTTKVFRIEVENTLKIVTAAVLPTGRVNVNYSVTLQATGGTGDYTWTTKPGLPPPGCSFMSTGVLSGKPSTAGTYSAEITVKDSSGTTASRVFQLTIVDPVRIISTTPLRKGYIDESYSQQLEAEGGKPGYTWSFSGPVPGLTFASTGRISGTPNREGPYSVTATVRDTAGQTDTKTFSIRIVRRLVITTTQPPRAYKEESYTSTVGASGGVPAYQWSHAGALPTGITFANGTLSGTPTVTGSFPFVATVTDTDGDTATKLLTLRVVERLDITTTALKRAMIGRAYDQTVAAKGGTPAYTWSCSPTPGNGLTFNTASARLQSNSVTASAGTQTYSFTVRDNDPDLPRQADTQSIALTVVDPLAITTVSPLPDATSGVDYLQQFQAAGGTQPYQWSATGEIPPGLNFTLNGELRGAPAATAARSTPYQWTVKVVDKDGYETTRAFELQVLKRQFIGSLEYRMTADSSWAAVPDPLRIQKGKTVEFRAVKGYPELAWPNGKPVWGGTAGARGTAATKKVRFDVVSSNMSDYKTVTAECRNTEVANVLVLDSPVRIITETIPNGRVGVPYSVKFLGEGGDGDLGWIATNGELPEGLVFTGPALTLAGTPTKAGNGSFSVKLMDESGHEAVRNFSFTISPAPPIQIQTTTLPPAVIGTPYSFQLQAVGGYGEYAWKTVSGDLPAGLSLVSNGEIFGTPALMADQTTNFSLSVEDESGLSASLAFSMEVDYPETDGTPSDSFGRLGPRHWIDGVLSPGTVAAAATSAAAAPRPRVLEGHTQQDTATALGPLNNVQQGEPRYNPELFKKGTVWFVVEEGAYPGELKGKPHRIDVKVTMPSNRLYLGMQQLNQIFDRVVAELSEEELRARHATRRPKEAKWRTNPEKAAKYFEKLLEWKKAYWEARVWEEVGALVRNPATCPAGVAEVVLEHHPVYNPDGPGRWVVVRDTSKIKFTRNLLGYVQQLVRLGLLQSCTAPETEAAYRLARDQNVGRIMEVLKFGPNALRYARVAGGLLMVVAIGADIHEVVVAKNKLKVGFQKAGAWIGATAFSAQFASQWLWLNGLGPWGTAGYGVGILASGAVGYWMGSQAGANVYELFIDRGNPVRTPQFQSNHAGLGSLQALRGSAVRLGSQSVQPNTAARKVRTLVPRRTP